MQYDLPLPFKERLQSELGQSEAAALLAALDGKAPVSRHWNPTKSPPPAGLNPVPWYSRGEYLAERPVFTLDPAFQAGAYYVQEAGSMFVAWLAQRWLPTDRPWRILDLCAAPGGKSCLLAASAPPGSLLVSNEVIKSRYPILSYNLSKWGLDHCYSSNLDPERFAALRAWFDLVLVDAPCSGEGLFRKDPASRQVWNPGLADLCAARQHRILAAAQPLVKPDGLLIYSSCTFNGLENEAQADALAAWGMELLPAVAPPEWNIEQSERGYRFYPHRVRTEGFFAVAARAKAETSPQPSGPPERPLPHWTLLPAAQRELVAPWLEKPHEYGLFTDKNGNIHALHQAQHSNATQLAQALGRIALGFPIGEIKGNNLIPAPELALHTSLSRQLPSLEVDILTAQQLLKRETPVLHGLGRGWHLITQGGRGLLWVKGLGHRYNNYYPSAWRIRMDLP